MPSTKFTAFLVDTKLVPVDGATARVLASGNSIIGTGPVSRGAFSITGNVAQNVLKKGVVLQLNLRASWKDLSSTIPSAGAAAVDFGTIVMLPKAISSRGSEVIGLSINTIGQMLSEYDADTRRLSSEISDLKGKANALEISNKTLSQAKEALERQIAALSSSVSEKDAIVNELTRKLQNVQATTHMTHSELISSFKTQLDKAIGDIASGPQTGSTVAYRPVSTRAEWKVVMSGDGMTFPTIDDLKALPPGSLSSITYEFGFDDGESTPPQKVKVPQTRGYTYSKACSVVESAGLCPELFYQTTEKKQEIGRVITQKPNASTNIEEGSIVQLFIGKTLEDGS
jgi:chaperonin cofactor prefoldin